MSSPDPKEPLPDPDWEEPVLFHELPFWRRGLIILSNEFQAFSLPSRIVLVLILVLVLLVPIYIVFQPAVKRWQQHNSLIAARKFQESGKLDEALAAFQKATANSDSVENWKAFALFADEIHAPEAAAIWQQATTLQPDDPGLQSRRIRALLAAGQLQAALATYRSLPADFQQNPLLLINYSQICLLLGQKEEAAQAFREVARVTSTLDEASQLAVAGLAADLGNPVEKADAVKTLAALAKSPNEKIKVPALRALLNVAAAAKLRIHLLEAAQQLAALPAASFGDRLTALNTLLGLKAPQASDAIVELERAATSPQRQARLARLLLDSNKQDAVEEWIKKLSSQGESPAAIARLKAEISLNKKDWPQLESDLAQAALPGATPDLLRVFFSANDYRAERPVYALDRWNGGLRQIQRPEELLRFMTLVAQKMGWNEAWEASRKRALELNPNDIEALRELTDFYREKRDLAALFDILTRWVKVEPGNLKLANMALLCRLILEYGEPNANLAAAEDLRNHDPKSPVLTTTYAVALFRAGRLAESAEIFATMDPKDLQSPERAVYYGYVLAALGRQTEATELLNKVSADESRLFPEVRELREKGLEMATAPPKKKNEPAPPPLPEPGGLSY